MRLYMNKIANLNNNDIAIIYKKPSLYKQIKSNKKVLIDSNGNIKEQNFFKYKDSNIEHLKQIVFRVYLSNNSCMKYTNTYGLTKKSARDIEKIYNSMIANFRRNIYKNQNKSILLEMLDGFNDETYDLYLSHIESVNGKRFVKIYSEAIEFLWNLSLSLFEIFLQDEFDIYENYKYTINAHRFFFCIDYLKKYSIEEKDLTSSYTFNINTVFMIFRLFEEKINKLHKQQKGDINFFISKELESFKNFKFQEKEIWYI